MQQSAVCVVQNVGVPVSRGPLPPPPSFLRVVASPPPLLVSVARLFFHYSGQGLHTALPSV
jgi:hypothetical protein